MTGALTAEEVQQRLGLLDPDIFALQAIHRNTQESQGDPELRLRDVPRRTGRTKRILIGAMVELSKGNAVYVSASTLHGERQMLDEGRHMARILGLDPEMVKPLRLAHFHIAKDHDMP